MVNISPRKMVMTGGWFMALFYQHYHIFFGLWLGLAHEYNAPAHFFPDFFLRGWNLKPKVVEFGHGLLFALHILTPWRLEIDHSWKDEAAEMARL